MHAPIRLGLFTLLVTGFSAGCSAYFPRPASPTAALRAERARPTPLHRSHFATHPGGRLDEETLQKILAAPVRFELPARVGVLPISRGFDWRGPAPDYGRPPRGARALAKALRRSETFSYVTEMLPIPSGALGMEALREIAARYQLRYLLLYGEALETAARPTPLAALYATLVGALFVQGHRLSAEGFVEATLFDAKTGTLLFTTRHEAREVGGSTPFAHARKLRELADDAATRAAPGLAKEVLALSRRLSGLTEQSGPARVGDGKPTASEPRASR